MKTHSIFLALAILIFKSSIAQYHPGAPWMNNDSKKNKNSNKPTNIDDLVGNFENYWKTHDKDKKGSGYKPFMRWLEHWKLNTHDDGTLISQKEIWDIWKLKNNFKKNGETARNNSNWEPVGPYSYKNSGSHSPGTGRINVICVDPNNDNVIYAGTPAGGLWKTLNGGNSWTPLTDHLPQIGISGIAIDHNNSNIIYIATGDGDGADTYSIGVLKSIDGGTTWNTTGLVFEETTDQTFGLEMNPSNSNILVVPTSKGLYKTIDGGVSWTKTLDGIIRDVKFKPKNPTTIYASSSNKFFKSTNSGEEFSEITKGLPANPNKKRIVIGVTPADSSRVYLMSENGSFYKSNDSGDSFTKSSNNKNLLESDQAYYDLAISVSPKDANLVFTGCLNIWKTTDGGNSFSKINNWNEPASQSYTHADIHFLKYFGSKLFCGSDGGIYVSKNNGTSFTDLSEGLQIGQFYKIAVAKETSKQIAGGLQDNGGYALSNNTWKNYYGADGTSAVIDPNNKNKIYGFTQHGSLLVVSHDGGNSTAFSLFNFNKGRWVTPLSINFKGEVFAGYQYLYKLENGNWKNTSKKRFSYGIKVMEIDPNNDSVIYATQNNQLLKSMDKGNTFKLSSNFNNAIEDITVDPLNSSIVYVVTSGTNGKVLKSTDAGKNFQNINNGLPDIGKNVIITIPQSQNETLCLGTYLGVYYKDKTMNSWKPFDNNLPNVSVTDLKFNLKDKKIVASTYGRGVWKTSINVNSDYQAPSSPKKLIATNTTDTSTFLNWNSSTDNFIVTSYEIFQGTKLIGQSQYTNFHVNGLVANSAYTFKVRAKDLSGNVSGFSNEILVQTISDTIKPLAPTNLKVSDVKNYSVDLTWNPSTDNIGVIEYHVLDKDSLIGKTKGTNFKVINLIIGKEYKFNIKARDKAGNLSNPSNIVGLIPEAKYCESKTETAEYEFIQRIQIGMLDNVSDAKVYSDFTHISTNLDKGSSYSFTITPGWDYGTEEEAYAVYIDYNQDKDFNDAGEKVWEKQPTTESPISGIINIPNTALVGKTRMRITMNFEEIKKPCGVYGYGEVEDYSIVIRNNSAVSSDPILTSKNTGLQSLEIFPNPVGENVLNVKIDKQELDYSIYNSIGKNILSGKLNGKSSISVKHLNKGMYIIKFSDGKNTIIKRFTKN